MQRNQGSDADAKRFREHELVTQVHSDKIGLIIGRKGDTIREIQARTGSAVQLPKASHSYVSMVDVRIIGGDCEEALKLIKRVTNGKQLQPRFEGTEISSDVRKIYVDVLNFVDSHFFVDVDDWAIEPVQRRVNEFADASRSGNIELCIFIDAITHRGIEVSVIL